jgi:putative spermidine/putrescine transport system permease protein
VLPLFLFLLASFIVPIGSMLARGVADSDVARTLPRVTGGAQALGRYALPDESAFAALACRHSRRARGGHARERRHAAQLRRRRVPLAPLRDRPAFAGLRSRVPARDALIAIDPKWGERETWAAIQPRRRGPSPTSICSPALDLRRDADRAIVGAPPEQAVFRNVLGRTLWISGVVTLVCLLIGYPVAYYISQQKPAKAGTAAVPRVAAVLDVALVRTGALGRPAASAKASSTTSSSRSARSTRRYG